MTRAIDIRPGDARAPRFTVSLGDVAVVLRFRWLPRTSTWSLLVETPDGEPLCPQLTVQAGAVVPLDTTHPGCPAGRLVWLGPETYARIDLGRSLRLVHDDGASA